MDCPLTLYLAGTLGTVDYMSPCGCYKMCDFTSCKFRRCGQLVTLNGLGSTATNTVSISGKSCGGSFPLVAASTGDLVTVSTQTAGGTYRIYPVTVNGVLRGIVEGL